MRRISESMVQCPVPFITDHSIFYIWITAIAHVKNDMQEMRADLKSYGHVEWYDMAEDLTEYSLSVTIEESSYHVNAVHN